MFVRVERIEGKMRVETCPISGTIERGADALEDAVQVRTLLGSKKDESELTMCTDVDRNDKSRICAPGSVKVIGRRQIEMYSKLIHTVAQRSPMGDGLVREVGHVSDFAQVAVIKIAPYLSLASHHRKNLATRGRAPWAVAAAAAAAVVTAAAAAEAVLATRRRWRRRAGKVAAVRGWYHARSVRTGVRGVLALRER